MIYLFLAQGFEEIEALATVDILRRAQLPVSTVGVGGKSITGAHGIEVQADVDAEEMDLPQMEMLILPGGMPGAKNLENSPRVQSALAYAWENRLYIAAICAAPSILGNLGMLRGREATCFPGYEERLLGARLSEKKVVRDGHIITASAAGVAMDFALELVELLKGRALAQSIRASMQCR